MSTFSNSTWHSRPVLCLASAMPLTTNSPISAFLSAPAKRYKTRRRFESGFTSGDAVPRLWPPSRPTPSHCLFPSLRTPALALAFCRLSSCIIVTTLASAPHVLCAATVLAHMQTRALPEVHFPACHLKHTSFLFSGRQEPRRRRHRGPWRDREATGESHGQGGARTW